MKPRVSTLCLFVFAVVATSRTAPGQVRFEQSPKLAELASSAVKAASERFPQEKLKDDDVAVTVADLRDAQHVKAGSYRGDAAIFPASVVKLFYLIAAHQWLQDGKLQDSD